MVSEKIFSGHELNTTNNRMEMMGAIVGLANAIGLTSNNDVNISITTDSQYLKNGITSWIEKWKKNGWKTANKKPVLNKDLWIQLDNIVGKRKIEWYWARGHSGHCQNEKVDAIARREASKAASILLEM